MGIRRPGAVSLLALPALLTATPAGADRAAAVPGSPDDVRPLEVGARVPAVTLTAPGGEAVELATLVERRPTVLIFYRGGW